MSRDQDNEAKEYLHSMNESQLDEVYKLMQAVLTKQPAEPICTQPRASA